MAKWVDISPSDWFYDEVIEASNIHLEDGSPFVVGISYGTFQSGAPYIYEEVEVTLPSTKVYSLSQKITPTADNPLYVYIDGVQTVFKDVRDNGGGTSDVELYIAPRVGAIVSFASYGKPEVDRFGKPVGVSTAPEYPTFTLSKSAQYEFDRYGKIREYLYAFGRPLQRVNPNNYSPPGGGTVTVVDPQDIAKELIGTSQDKYFVLGGIVYLPYNLNNVTCRLVYAYRDGFLKQTTEEFRGTSPQVLHTDRFFPNATITRAEAFVLMNRLRKTFYDRFTDIDAPDYDLYDKHTSYDGQRVFKLNGLYPAGAGSLEVKVNNVLQDFGVDYQEFDDHTVLFMIPLSEGDIVEFSYVKNKSTEMYDVGQVVSFVSPLETITLDGTVDPTNPDNSSWWAENILAMEDEYYEREDGVKRPLVEGMTTTNWDYSSTGGFIVNVDSDRRPTSGSKTPRRFFFPGAPMTRAEAMTVMNRFRKWCVSTFK